MPKLHLVEGVWLPDADSRAELEGVREVEVVPAKAKAVTNKQRGSMYHYCGQVADALNAAGKDMRVVIPEGIPIAWSGDMVKRIMWDYIMEAMTGAQSSTEMDTVQPSEIHRELDKYLAEKHDVSFPWPSKSPPLMGG